MERYRRLVVGVDVLDYGRTTSQGSQAAVRRACWLAKQNSGTLTLLYSHYKRPSSPMFEQQAVDDLVRKLRSDGVDATAVVSDKRPSDEMVAMAEAGDIDMIFVGKRNRHEGAQTTLGNVARKLMRTSPVPVWAVDPYAREVSSVIVAHDLREVGSRAARLGARMATLSNCPLHLVHAWKVPLSLQMSEGRISGREYREAERELADEVITRMKKDMEGVASPEPAVYHEGCGAASTVIVETAARVDASLLVMGTLARTGIAGLLVGNTAEKVLDQAPCSLLTVKPEDFVVPPVEERRHTTQILQNRSTDGDTEEG